MSEQDTALPLREKDKNEVMGARMLSNAAIARKDLAGVSHYWMEDIVVISGEGGKYTGKKNLVKVWKEMFGQDIPLFERIPLEIKISKDGQLAWESGRWGYLDGTPGGDYAAMWCKVKGRWMTRSELFVALD